MERKNKKCARSSTNICYTHGLLICTLISENQGLEKSKSASNLRNISVPASLDVCLGLQQKLDLYHESEKIEVLK